MSAMDDLGRLLFCQRWFCWRLATHAERRIGWDRWRCEKHADNLVAGLPLEEWR